MPRDIDADHRAALEASAGEDDPLCFLVLDHDDLAAPIRVVSDTGTEDGEPVEWTYGGNDYIAFPFVLEWVTDNDGPPTARIEIANVDRTIGEVLRGLTSPATVSLTVIPPSEFVTTTNPRTEIGTATVIMSAANLSLRDVEVDAVSVRGTLASLDDTREPYPALRATQALLPGLYR